MAENKNNEVKSLAEQSANLKLLNGLHTGQVKWFNRKRGYGFIKILKSDNLVEGDDNFIGKDVFVHQSHIKPHKSTFRSLEENEYVEFGLSLDEKNTTQAVSVTGVMGGSLLCDAYADRQRYNREMANKHSAEAN